MFKLFKYSMQPCTIPFFLNKKTNLFLMIFVTIGGRGAGAEMDKQTNKTRTNNNKKHWAGLNIVYLEVVWNTKQIENFILIAYWLCRLP